MRTGQPSLAGLCALLALSLVAAAPAPPSPPPYLNHEGLLLDADGLPLQGQVVLRFALYGQEVGGNTLWFEEYQLALVDGYYGLLLGSQTPLDGIFDGNPRWLGISVNGGPELTPRRAVASVPYALLAQSAQSATTAQSATSAQTAQNVVGDITPRTITVNGKLIVDAQGNVTGQPPGGQGYNTAPQVLAALLTVDGAGSGLDADTLDGHDGADFLLVSQLQAKIQAVDGPGSGLDADRLDGLDGAAYATQADLALGLAAVDADRLDGLESTDFLLAGAQSADADRLDGKHAADFLGSGATAVDSDKLDGKHAAAFLAFDAGKTDAAAQLVDWLAAKYPNSQGVPINVHQLDGKHAADFVPAGAGGTAANADTVDARHAADFLDLASNKALGALDADKLATFGPEAFLKATAQATNADKLDGQHAAAFLGASAQATDADRLDGLHAADFLVVATKTALRAVDSDTVDGLHANAFVPAGGNAATATSADLLDGQHAVAFLPVGGNAVSATNADLLDGKHLGEFLDATTLKALNAEKLDALDSSQFMRTDASTSTTGDLSVGGIVNVGGDLHAGGVLYASDLRVTGRVGVGVAHPGVALEVAGAVQADGFGGLGGAVVAARAIIYAGVANGLGPSSSFSVILRRHSPGTSLEVNCNGINGGWHACGIAKGNYVYQDCGELSNDSYGGGYTAWVRAAQAQAYLNDGSYASCNSSNMLVGCSPACGGW